MEFKKAPRSIRIEGQNKIQTPICTVVSSSPEYNKFDIRVNQEFIDEWRKIEEQAKTFVNFEWSSILMDDILRIKYDDDSMFFNERKEIVEPVIRVGCRCIMIIECLSVYSFNKKNGINARIHQCLIFDPECVL